MPPKRKREGEELILPKKQRAFKAKASTSAAPPEHDDDFDVLAAQTDVKPKKKARTKKAEPAGEKRLARWKPKCPQNIKDRVARVMSQRFFMIDREKQGPVQEVFKVLGSTGNVYEVTVGPMLGCSCPDGSKGNHCKHILFCLLKVLGLPLSGELYYQKALLTSELEQIFAQANPNPKEVQNAKISHAYKVSIGEASADDVVEDDPGGRRNLPESGDTCPICYEDFEPKQTKGLKFCPTCGGGLHTECFTQWARKQSPPTCVFCRAAYPASVSANSSAAAYVDEDGYTNLGAAAGLPSHRDGSTYYQGPVRGVSLGRTAYYHANRYGGY